MITNAEISIFQGDVKKGNHGFLWSVRVGNHYHKAIVCCPDRRTAAEIAAEHIDAYERVQDAAVHD